MLKGLHPMVWLTSWDGTTTIEFMGGQSLPNRFEAPECIQLGEAPKGLIASWKTIDQQGASEDGVTFIDAANEPLEIDLPVRCVARDGIQLRKVVRDMWGALDTIKTSTLHWWTPELGYWYTPVRLWKPPAEGHSVGGQRRSYKTTLRLRGDLGFWKGLPDVDEFRFAYDQASDAFDTDYSTGLGPHWPVWYTGRGGGYVFASRGQARWRDDPNKRFRTEGKTLVAGPYSDDDFDGTETDYQVVEVDLGSMLEFGAAVDVWGRMGRNSDGSWNGYGTRLRMAGASVKFSAFNNYTETTIKGWIATPPLPKTTVRVEFGDPDANNGAGDPRVLKVRRGLIGDGLTLLTAKDEAGVAQLGASFRGVGWGSYASGALITQGTPSTITGFRGGDADSTTQTGHLYRTNAGTIRAFDSYTLYGPGIFEIAAGPGSSDMVKIGPLLPNQRVRVNADGRKQFIEDFTKVPATAAQLLEYRDWLKDLESYAPVGNIGPTVQSNASIHGVVPPQGNMHRLVSGRFTRPIPEKPAGADPQTVAVAVSISGGNSDSRIISSLTPLRRYPQ